MLELNSVRFEQGLNNATSMAESAMKRVEGAANLAKVALGGLAGAVSLGGIVAFVKNTIEATANLKDMAENTNATVEQLSALARIAKRSGQDMDSVVVGLQKLSRQMVAAAGGSKEAVQSFATFGITAAEVRAKLNDPAVLKACIPGCEELNVVGENEFEATDPTAWHSGTAGGVFGSVKSGYVEISNVDLSQEFSDLVIMQRGYQASSQVVSAANEMLQELFAMKKG